MYKLETHLHTKGNSGCAKEEPKTIAELYKAAGYDGVFCTNHFNKNILFKYFDEKTEKEKLERYLNGYRQLKAEGEKLGLDVFFGVEFALKKDYYHSPGKLRWAEMLVYGITPEDVLKYGTALADTSYSDFRALSKEKGWIVIQAHPFRENTKRIPPEFIDGLEVYNGHPRHLARNEKSKARAEKYDLLTTAGSDFHFKGGEGVAMLFETPVTDEEDFIKKIKKGNYVLEKGRNKVK